MLAAALLAAAALAVQTLNVLTPEEKRHGWILLFDGKSTDGMTSDVVAKTLKGPKGTHVSMTTVREGQSKPLSFDLVRDEIPHPSVDLKYEIRPGIGYIHLTQFQQTTAREVDEPRHCCY